jgi:uncharacterized Zn finger protein (UPF0148 family)
MCHPLSITAFQAKQAASRCDTCGARLHVFEGESYCPDCTAIVPTDLPQVQVQSFHVVHQRKNGRRYISRGYPTEQEAERTGRALTKNPTVLVVLIAEAREVPEALNLPDSLLTGDGRHGNR